MSIAVALGSDHAGYHLKELVKVHLLELGVKVVDFGASASDVAVDYPRYCAPAARAAVAGRVDFAIVFGGSGQGEQIAANKVQGARAALCFNELSARLARQHNDANVLALGSRLIGVELAIAIVDSFLGSSFEGGRHSRRVQLLSDLESGVDIDEAEPR
ncbi:MAG: ribose 5-phosphate isomerase B [Acidimicrobiaceae bacterium]|nr:ribose 5-phosphate isomerase B [Acidimicrobiaceae bacterium]